MIIKQEKLLQYFRDMAEFSEKFPLLTLQDVNIMELAKHWGYPPLELMASVVFLDAMKTANQNSEISYYIDMDKVKKMKVTRKGKEWTFLIESKENKSFKLKHHY